MPLLCNIDLVDLFFENYSSDFPNFADNANPCECGHIHNKTMQNLEITIEREFAWFSFNNLKKMPLHAISLFLLPVSGNLRSFIIERNCEKCLGI